MQTSSFTLRSSAGTILVLALAAVLSAAFSWHAKCHWQIDNRYWGEALRISERYAGRLSGSHASRYVVFGGSTVRTSYIPSVFEREFGISLVNLGLHAGCGPDILAETAFRTIRPGDRVVVAVEPAFLVRETDVPPTSGGIDLFLWANGLSFKKGTFFTLSPFQAPGFFRSSTRYNLLFLAKRILRRKPYRYTVAENLHEDGWMEVSERRPIPFDASERPLEPLRLGAAGRSFLLRVKTECERRGCPVVCAFPPSLDGNPNARSAYATLALDVLPVMPVVRDPLLGVNPNPGEFADTDHHPLRIGALRATRSLGKALAAGNCWDVASLREIIRSNAVASKLP